MSIYTGDKLSDEQAVKFIGDEADADMVSRFIRSLEQQKRGGAISMFEQNFYTSEAYDQAWSDTEAMDDPTVTDHSGDAFSDHPLGPYWESMEPAGDETAAGDRADSTDLPPPDPPDRNLAGTGDMPDEPRPYGVGRFIHLAPQPAEIPQVAAALHQSVTAGLAAHAPYIDRDYVDSEDQPRTSLRLENNTPEGNALLGLDADGSMTVEFTDGDEMLVTHHYRIIDGAVYERSEGIWDVLVKDNNLTDTAQIIDHLLSDIDELNYSTPHAESESNADAAADKAPEWRPVSLPEMLYLAELVRTAHPVNVTFNELYDEAVARTANPLDEQSPATNDELLWAAQEFASYVWKAVITNSLNFKAVGNEATGAHVYVEFGHGSPTLAESMRQAQHDYDESYGTEHATPNEESFLEPYVHIIYERPVGRDFIDSIPAQYPEELAGIRSARERIELSYTLVEGKLRYTYRREIGRSSGKGKPIIAGPWLPVQGTRATARMVRNLLRHPTVPDEPPRI